jgi:hypothetical protein
VPAGMGPVDFVPVPEGSGEMRAGSRPMAGMEIGRGRRRRWAEKISVASGGELDFIGAVATVGWVCCAGARRKGSAGGVGPRT